MKIQTYSISVYTKSNRYLQLMDHKTLLQTIIMSDDGNVFAHQLYIHGSITDPKGQNSLGILQFSCILSITFWSRDVNFHWSKFLNEQMSWRTQVLVALLTGGRLHTKSPALLFQCPYSPSKQKCIIFEEICPRVLFISVTFFL